MTRIMHKINSKQECKIDHCAAEEWMYEYYGTYPKKDICLTCPFMKYINRLATIEDEIKLMENDCK